MPPRVPAPAPTAPLPGTAEAIQPDETLPADTPTSASPSSTAAAPSSESTWNKPVPRSTGPTQAAAARTGAPGSGGLNLSIPAGVLLVGMSAGAFALWGRNRLRSH